MMSSEQRYWWKIALELKLRKSSGDSFQEFFSLLMGKLHGDDFVRVRAFGALGDKGCDGYLQSNGQVFQCYGALNADKGKVAHLIKKMETDFNTASTKLSSIMKEWHMVHNIVDGLPVEAIEKLEEIKEANPLCNCGFVGYDGFEERVFALEPNNIEDLLGVVATKQDAEDLQATELRDLVAAVVQAADEVNFDVTTIRPVPADKIDQNKLPSHWRSLIAGGWQNAHLVVTYLESHPDPMVGETIAQGFRVRYQYLKSQNLSPSNIMSSLYEYVTGPASVSAERQVAAQALLSYLFESCDIFENTTDVKPL